MINLSIHLYGKPSWDMNIEGEEDIDPQMLKEHGEFLRHHLYNVAEVMEKLKLNGWECYGMLYDIEFNHKKVTNESQAKKELKKLGIDPDFFSFFEYEDED